MRRSPTATTRSISIRRRPACAHELIRQAIDAGKHIYTEKPVARRSPTRSISTGAPSARACATASCRTSSGCPGCMKLQHADRQRLLRTHPVGARRVRLLGLRRRLAAGAAAVVELPQGGRRRHHRRHAVPLALRARQPVRRREERDVHRRHAHSRSAGTSAASRYAATADDAAYATFELAHGVIAQINSSWCTRVRRDDLVTFHVDGTHGSAVAGLTECYMQPRAATPKPVWNPDIPQTIDFYDTWQKMPANRAYDNAFKVGVGAVSSACRRGRAVPLEPAGGREGRAARGTRPAQLGRAALARRAGARSPDRRQHAMQTLELPQADGRLAAYTLCGTPIAGAATARPRWNRVAFAAAHVVADPLAERRPVAFGAPSTGTRRSPTAATCGSRASASPKRWTPRSAAWASTGRRRSS